MVDRVPRWHLSLSKPIQSDHLSIPDYDDTAFEAGTLTRTFLESRSMNVENFFIYFINLLKFVKKYSTQVVFNMHAHYNGNFYITVDSRGVWDAEITSTPGIEKLSTALNFITT